MFIGLDPTGTPAGLAKILRETTATGEANGILILACDANGFSPENLDPILKSSPVPIFGGIFPHVIYGKKLLTHGTIAIGLPHVIQSVFIPHLSSTDTDYESVLDALIPDPGSCRTMIVFVDGFAKCISAFIESLFNVFGLQINYVGGGAGSLSMQQKPCLLTNQGLMTDGAVLVPLESRCGVGVCHGWRILSGPYRVTESDRNIIKSLNWRPAFDVYHEAVAPHIGRSFSEAEFFELSKGYPFGIARIDNEQIIRDPIKVAQDRSLVCVGEVPEGSFVSIMNGDETSLIQAARNALEQARHALPEVSHESIRIFIDCISRVLFLGDRFGIELEAVDRGEVPLVGACTIGEIADCGGEFLEFYNKTAVVASLEDL